MRPACILSIVLAGLLLPWAAVGAQQNAPTYYAGRSKSVIRLQRAPDGKLFLIATVQGRPLTLMVDTGATMLIDSSVARRLGLALTDTKDVGYGLTGITATRKAAVIDMEIGGLRITDLPVSSLDMSALRNFHREQRIPIFDGVIGSELMAVLRARIDFDKLTLEIRRPDNKSIAEELRRRAGP